MGKVQRGLRGMVTVSVAAKEQTPPSALLSTDPKWKPCNPNPAFLQLQNLHPRPRVCEVSLACIRILA